MVYLLWIEKTERQAYADQLTVALVAVLSGQAADIPTALSARQEFDTWLCSEPETVDPDREALMIALGLR